MRLHSWIEATRSERGTSMAEFALIVSVISFGIVAVVGVFGDAVGEMWAGAVALM